MYKIFLRAFIGLLTQILSLTLVVELVDIFIVPLKSSIKTTIVGMFLFTVFIIFEIVSTYDSEYGVESSEVKFFLKLFMCKEREQLGLGHTVLMSGLIMGVLVIIQRFFYSFS